MGDAQATGEFFFEMVDGSLGWAILIEIFEGSLQQVAEIGDWGCRFGDFFDQFHEIGCCEGLYVAVADADTGSQDGDIFQDVEVTFSTADKFDFTMEKEIQFPRKAIFGSAGALGYGLDQSL